MTKVERLKRYYDASPQLFTDDMVANLVGYNVLTEDEYQAITGRVYTGYAHFGVLTFSLSYPLTLTNPVLGKHEVLIETDTGKIKVGDGESNYNDIEYLPSSVDTPTMPPSDGNMYIVKNGQYVPVTGSGIVTFDELAPVITENQELELGVDSAMTAYTVQGKRVSLGAVAPDSDDNEEE